jgi:CheY-like chemotaxis protein
VHLHGGAVTAHSEGRGRGSEFVVRLPLCAEPLASLPAPSATETAPACRVAVIDDEPDARLAMAHLLGIWGHDVQCASDGREGIELILAWRPDLALVDLGMPRLDGYGLLAGVREALGDAAPRMVALTGYGQHDDRRKTEAAGFDEHLVKPVPADDLRRAVLRGALHDMERSGHDAEGTQRPEDERRRRGRDEEAQDAPA